jgi:hypothetical protein
MPLSGLCRGNQKELAQGPQNIGLLARQPFNMRHSSEGLESELFEEGQQLVVRLIAFGSALYGVGLC